MKKIKKKAKKRLIIYLTTAIILVILAIVYINYDKIKTYFNDVKEEPEEIKEEEPKKEENIFAKEDGYKLINLERYKAYQENNQDLTTEKVVTYVNIGLDNNYYENTKATDLTKGDQILVNKYNYLTSDFIPSNLESISDEYFISGNAYVREMSHVARVAFEDLSKASIKEGYPVYGQSAYREYEMQDRLYNNAVASMGKEYADNDTARPGYSEHQTGLTVDVSSTKGGDMLTFDQTDSFTWMQNNAYKYGFILRYPEGKVDITGFMYESWHYRYIGVEVATDMHNNYKDLTYDEYYVKFLEK